MTVPLFRRILLTNDDGIDAPGLATLAGVAAGLTEDLWIVAPACDRSGVSHAVSLQDPLRVHQHGPRKFAVDGTPGDCVAIAARHIMLDDPPSLVLSGINCGANLGVETVFSGTVGAAMTASLLGIPAFALSQAYRDRAAVPWSTAASLAPGIIRSLAGLALPDRV